MHSSAHHDGLHRRRILVATATLVALLAAAGLYAALSGPHSSQAIDHDHETVGPGSPDPAANLTPSGGVLPGLDPTADAESFARLAAHALFDWDTTAVVPLSDYTNRIVAIADPTGESSPGLVADVAGYLPSAAAWSQLRSYSTRQWLSIETLEVPTLWSQAQAEAGPDGLLPGTTAYTIHGVRHRTGIWEGEPVSSEHDIAFTVFIVCAPAYPECHLLRLSRLDEPLR